MSGTAFASFRISAITRILLIVFILGVAVYLPSPVRAASPTTCSATPDFLPDATPNPLNLGASATGTSNLTFTPLNGFTGIVSLVLVNVDPNLTPKLSTMSLDLSSGPKTATLTVTTSNAVAAGNFYTLEVNATSGSLFHDTTISVYVPVPEIGITSSQLFLTVDTGSSVTNMISLQALYGLTDTSASLTATLINLLNPTATAPSYSFNPPSPLTLTAGTGTSTMTISASSSTTPGVYTADVQATTTPSSFTNDTLFYLTVRTPGLGVDASPSDLIIPAGLSDVSTINVTSILSFAGSVTLSATALPPGPTAIFANPNPTLPANSYATSALTITAPSSTGSYVVTVTATSGTTTNSTTVRVTVPGPSFSMDANPSSMTVSQGGSTATSTITVGSANQFVGAVNLSIDCSPDGLDASLSPSSVTLTSGGTKTATLTVSAYSFAAPGDYGITVYGNAAVGPVSNQTSIDVTVTGPNFGLSANPSSIPLTTGGTTTSTITATSILGFSGTITLTAEVETLLGPATGLTATLSPTSVSLSSGQTAGSTLTLSASLPGAYFVIVTGTSWPLENSTVISVDVTVTGPSPDFTIAATTPASEPADGTSSAVSTINITPLDGFSGTVSLADTPLPSGLSCTAISPNSISGSTSATLSCTSTTANSYTVTVTGTSSSLTHTASTTFTFTSVSAPDFAISATSGTAVADGSSSATSTIALNPVNGFSGTVTLSDNPLPSGLTCQAFSHATISDSGQSSLSCSSTTAKSYAVTITGTSGSLARTTTATFTFTSVPITGTPGIAMTTSTSSLSFTSGASGTTIITITPQNGFTGTTVLSVSPSSNGVSCSLSSTTIQPSGTSTLTCNSSTAGDYTVTITATPSGGASSHTTTVSVHVAAVSPAAPTPSTTIFGLSPILFYAIIGVIIVVVIAGAALVFTRSRPKVP